MWYMENKASGDRGDAMDYGEQFDRMETAKIMENDPDSLAFFKANKSMRGARWKNKTALKNALQKRRV